MPSRSLASDPTFEGGQVLVLVALGLVVLLGITGIAVDLGRLMAERRHLQTAADAAALAACQSLTSGAVADISAATQQARRVAAINMEGSPSGTVGVMADPAVYDDQDGNAFLEADELVSGVVVSSGSARVAISADVSTTFARVVGIPTLGVGARAQCTLVQEPALPIVARRYTAPPGPGGGFIDVLATEATSTSGQVDANPLGYDVRFPASAGTPGPLFEIYGTGSKAHNSSEFRGFINLDIRDFRDLTTREYYNGAEPGVNENTMKAEQAEYVIAGYPGPGFPAVSATPTGALQVATLSGHNTGHLVDAFDDMFGAGDRILLAVYDGTVKAIPDFQILPPIAAHAALHHREPADGPQLHRLTQRPVQRSRRAGADRRRGCARSADNILPSRATIRRRPATMNEPLFNPDNFTFSGTATSQLDRPRWRTSRRTHPPGIYTVWLMGDVERPDKSQAHPVPVYVGGATRGFNITSHSSLSARPPNYGDTVTYTIQVRPRAGQTSGPPRWR
jgi:Flp pilus assembly protein TadG